MPEIELLVGGERYRGFTQGRVRMSLDEVASSFDVSYFDQAQDHRESWPIVAGDQVAIIVDGETAVTGYVDADDASYSSSSRQLKVSGRSKTADLVDCSIVGKRRWTNQDLWQIASDVCYPFEVGVVVGDIDRKRFPKAQARKGETVVAFLQRLCKRRGAYPTTDQDGQLLLARAGHINTSTRLVRGEGLILEGSRRTDYRSRYKEYRFTGQTRATDEVSGESGTHLNHKVEDPAITRYRPLVMQAGSVDGSGDLGERTVLERNKRAGKSEQITYTVRGFKHGVSNRALWRPNTLVEVEDNWLRINGRFLVTTVEYEFGGKLGFVTKLTLTRPEAYDLNDYPAQGRGDVWS